jgi:hypothetical protein
VFAFTCASAVASVAFPYPASAQIKPYVLLVFDTSGSMTDAIGTNDSCGYTGSTKMSAAKCAVSKIVDAAGDVDFGLMQFSKGSSNTVCTGGTCNTTSASGWMRQGITTNTSSTIQTLVDDSGSGPVDELCAGGGTPLGGTLALAREYYQGASSPSVDDAAMACRPYAVVLLTDGVECCGGCSVVGEGCPLAKVAHAADGVDCADGCSSVTGCGSSQHSETAPERAHELAHTTYVPLASGENCNMMPRPASCTLKEVRTYAIGFGIAAGDARIERIAITGHTDAPGANRGFYVDNEAALSLALTQIIADAQPPLEECNNADDDCDTLIDEGITKYCDLPHGIMDRELCVEPPESECDGKDDDCDGRIDEGLLDACGHCESDDETCDGEDNDCDSRVDEEIDELGACGTDVGLCEKGKLLCIAGEPTCKGGVGPEPETCDCEDNDCDGLVDEGGDGPLCPGEKVCLGCECVEPCGMTAEFAASCPPGLRVEFQESGLCLCVTDTCDRTECGASTVTRAEGPVCAPDDEALGTCVCKAGACVARCDGITCASGEICDKPTGRCIENNCRGLGCAEGETCDPLDGACVEDACAGRCEADQVCRMGVCEASCADVACGDGRRCASGACVVDHCAGVVCTGTDVCLAEQGHCAKNPCVSVTCAAGLACDTTSGECVRDACWQVRCPEGQACRAGQCGVSVAADGAGRPLTESERERFLVTGAGGCTCRVGGGETGAGGDGWLTGLALFVVLAWRGRRRIRRGAARAHATARPSAAVLASAWIAGAAVGSGGCEVEPYCLNCVDGAVVVNGEIVIGGGSGVGAGGADAGGMGGLTMPDGGLKPVTDGGPMPPGDCDRDAKEDCNGRDDDCDFKVDEEAAIAKNDCETHGVCAGTEPICLGGKAACRYPPEWEMDETVCDGLDNDCDGRIDEAFKKLGDTCSVGVGACTKEGRMACNAAGNDLVCNAEPKKSKQEVCDGVDNDCDGLVDEPKSDPGPEPSYVVDPVVQVGASLWVYAYEASRPDATHDDSGIIDARACAREGVLPWTNVDRDEAIAACAGADMALCTDVQWVSACEAGAVCGWAFTPASGTCDDYLMEGADDCNGHDVSAAPGSADTDALAPTGSFATCYADHPDGPIFDLSGNAKEWTTGANSPAENPLLGGSYNNPPGGLRCDFDFTVAPPDLRVANIGFRCCTTTAP